MSSSVEGIPVRASVIVAAAEVVLDEPCNRWIGTNGLCDSVTEAVLYGCEVASMEADSRSIPGGGFKTPPLRLSGCDPLGKRLRRLVLADAELTRDHCPGGPALPCEADGAQHRVSDLASQQLVRSDVDQVDQRPACAQVELDLAALELVEPLGVGQVVLDHHRNHRPSGPVLRSCLHGMDNARVSIIHHDQLQRRPVRCGTDDERPAVLYYWLAQQMTHGVDDVGIADAVLARRRGDPHRHTLRHGSPSVDVVVHKEVA